VAERNCYGLTTKLKAAIFKEKTARENVIQIILRNLKPDMVKYSSR